MAEYALRGYTAPIGVAEWKTAITECLPAELESSLPTVEELEGELADGSGGIAHEGEDHCPQDQGIIAKHVRRESQNKAIQKRLRDADDELQIVTVKDMMLTGFDAPPLHTLYLDRPLNALLMQTPARVNRTFRGKPSGLLVAYAPLVDNLAAALAEYTETDRNTKPVGKDIDTAVKLTTDLVPQLDELCAGYDWRSKVKAPQHGWMKAAIGLTAYLRSPSTPGNQVPEGEPTLGDRFRKLANHLARAWTLCAGNETLDMLRPTVKFYEQVRVWMGKFDAQQRQAEGKPIPDDIKRLLSTLVASGEIIDIYDAAGLPKVSLSELGPDYEAKAKAAAHPHLAIEALRAVLTEELSTATKNNLVRQRAFSDRIADLMRRYTNQQLTSAEVIAELIAMAKEVAAEVTGVSGSRRRCRMTSWPSTTRWPRTSRPLNCKVKRCSPRSRANWSA